MSRLLLILLICGAITACSQVTVDEYAQRSPEFSPENFFDGRLTAHGVLKDYRGKVTRQFTADIVASWQDGVGTLDESFVFDDGERQKRVWTLTPDGADSYIGRAGDVVGDAKINVAGNSLFLKYVLRIPYNDGTLDVTIDDRMYLINDKVLLNESVLKKFGFKVGSLMLVISKP